MRRSAVIRELGLIDYGTAWTRMREFTDARGPETLDELWSLQHPSVFTLGLGGSPAHVLAAGDIPVIKCDRGGQVTYHGPGQLVVYLMLDLKRLGLGPKELVRRLESAIISVLGALNLPGERREGAPGVYVGAAKIAALGLRVRRQCSYHGVSLNVSNDLEPFARINPCGYAGMPVTSLTALGHRVDVAGVTPALINALQDALGLAETTAGMTPATSNSG